MLIYLSIVCNLILKIIFFFYSNFLYLTYVILFTNKKFVCYYYEKKLYYYYPYDDSLNIKNIDILAVSLMENNIENFDYDLTKKFLQVYGPYKNFHNSLINIHDFLKLCNVKINKKSIYNLKIYDKKFNEFTLNDEYLNNITAI